MSVWFILHKYGVTVTLFRQSIWSEKETVLATLKGYCSTWWWPWQRVWRWQEGTFIAKFLFSTPASPTFIRKEGTVYCQPGIKRGTSFWDTLVLTFPSGTGLTAMLVNKSRRSDGVLIRKWNHPHHADTVAVWTWCNRALLRSWSFVTLDEQRRQHGNQNPGTTSIAWERDLQTYHWKCKMQVEKKSMSSRAIEGSLLKL
jgi:hypothetical protein